jgi:hypothetical protein
MRLLFTGSFLPPEATFMRLLLVADEIAVMDRPSINFGDWGTVGSTSPMRSWIPAFAETPVRLVAIRRHPGQSPLRVRPRSPSHS